MLRFVVMFAQILPTMTLKKSLAIAVSLAVLAACSKDKETIKSIEGTWSETEINGMAVAPAAQDKLEFGPCKNREKELCDCNVYDASGVLAGTLDYEIADEGTSLVIKYHYNGLTSSQSHTIA